VGNRKSRASLELGRRLSASKQDAEKQMIHDAISEQIDE
jgi:hypothetical protein